MDWYKRIVKTSAPDRRAIPLRHKIEKYEDGTADVIFWMQRPGGTFKLMSKKPIRINNLYGDSSSIFIRLKDSGMLTTPKARRDLDYQKEIQYQKQQESVNVEHPPEQIEEVEETKKPPEQLQFNFSSNRSKFLHKKIKNGFVNDTEINKEKFDVKKEKSNVLDNTE